MLVVALTALSLCEELSPHTREIYPKSVAKEDDVTIFRLALLRYAEHTAVCEQ